MNRKSFGRKALLAFSMLVALAACTDSSERSRDFEQAVNGATISTDLTNYPVDQDITVSWTGMPGNSQDWVAITTAGSPADSGFVAFTYINSQTSGTFTFNGLQGGAYEARAYQQGTYTILAKSNFSVAGVQGGVTVTTDKTAYINNELVQVSWNGLPGNPQDWIAIVTAGSPPDSGFVQFAYANGQVNGNHSFEGLPSGSYEARAYQSDSYTVLGTTMFTISGVTISTDKTLYSAMDTVTLTWTGMPGNPLDYVAVSLAGSPATSTVQQAFTSGQVNGSQAFTGLAAGDYEARAYLTGTSTILASSTFSVTGAVVTTDAATYTVGQTITVSFSGLPGNATDWVAIATSGSSDSAGVVTWAYTNGQTSGSMQFDNVPLGSYEARAYLNNTFNVGARSAVFTVGTSNTCVSASTRPVLGSFSSGDLVIDSTQSENTVALTVDLPSSIFFMSVSENEPSPKYGAVFCELHDVDTVNSKPAGITCSRNNPGTDTGSGTVTVHWSVATFSSGVTVQRGNVDTHDAATSTVALTTIDLTQSFVLLGGQFNDGSGWGNNEFVRAQLTDSQTLSLSTNVAGTQVAYQVVSMVGATVQRGTASLTTADLQQAVAITTAPTGSVLFASYTTDNASGVAAATLMLSSTLMDPNTVVFNRDLGGSNLDVSWEVVSLPFATHSGTTNFAAGETSKSASVPGIVSSSSVGVCSSQSILGQSFGSTSYAGSSLDDVGEAAVSLSTGTDTLTLQRATSQGTAEIPWTVIDFAHDCTGL